MDIKTQIKRGLATVAAAAVALTSFAGLALAEHPFGDVPAGHWAEMALDELSTLDLVNTSFENFNGGQPVNRYEAAQFVANLLGSTEGFVLPSESSFSDMSIDFWAAPAVESLAALGVITGNPDGTYAGDRNLNRAEAAALMERALQLADLNSENPFSDVPAGQWFTRSVVTAYDWSVVNGDDGANTYRPADTLIRYEMAQIIYNGLNPELRPGGVVDPCEEDPESEACLGPVTEGDLTFKINSNSPNQDDPLTNLPLGAQGVELLTFDVSANGGDAKVSQITFVRVGVGDNDDFEVYLAEGTQRLSSEKTPSSDNDEVSINLSDFTVADGTTRTLSLMGNVTSDTSATTNQNWFTLPSADDVTTNAEDVAGNFPIIGGKFSIGSAAVSTVTLTSINSDDVTLGEQEAEITAFKATAGENDVWLQSLTLEQKGSFDLSDLGDLEDIKLFASDTEIATASGIDGDRLHFDLSDNAYEIKEGKNRNFYVYAHINGGSIGDTFKFILDEDSDARFLDGKYLFGAQVVNSTYTNAGVNEINVDGSPLTFFDESPASGQISVNATDEVITQFRAVAESEVDVLDTDITIKLEDEDGNIPDIPVNFTSSSINAAPTATGNSNEYDVQTAADMSGVLSAADMVKIGTSTYARVVSVDADTSNGGLVLYSDLDLTTTNGSAIVEDDPYKFIKNIELSNLETEDSFTGTFGDASDFTSSGSTNTTYTRVVSEDYTFPAGEVMVGLLIDLDSLMPSGYRVAGDVDYQADYLEDVNGDSLDISADVSGNPIEGNFQTIQAPTVTVSLASSVVDQDYVQGTDMADMIAVSLQAGQTGDIELDKIVFRVYTVDGSTVYPDNTGDGSANNFTSLVTLYQDGVEVGNEGLSSVGTAPNDYHTVTFDKLNIMIDESDTTTLVAKANIGKSKTGAIAFDVVPSEMDVKDDEENTLTLTSTGINTFNVNTFDVQHEVIGSGSLFVTESGSPDAALVVAGHEQDNEPAERVLVTSYELEAQDEAFKINDFKLYNHLTTTTGSADIDSDGGGSEKTVQSFCVNALGFADLEVDDVVTVPTAGGDVRTVITGITTNAGNVLCDDAGDTLITTSSDATNAVTNAATITENSGEFGTAQDTSTIAEVIVEYQDEEGVTQTEETTLNGGVATFNFNDFYVPENTTRPLDIYVRVANSSQGPTLSGKKFRLGLKTVETNNSDFEAVAVDSSTTINNPTISDSSNINEFIVRETVPTLSMPDDESTLSNSETVLYELDITADEAADMHLGRLTFNVTTNFGDITGADLYDFNFYRDGNKLLNTDVAIYCVDAALPSVNIFDDGGGVDATTLEVCDAGGNDGDMVNQTYTVIVAFLKKETVDEDGVSYQLRATAAGADSQTDDSVVTRLATGDDLVEVTGLTGNATNTNGNTGQIFVNGDATQGLYTTDANGREFFQSSVAGRAIIWSDGSGQPNKYPLLTGASVTGTGVNAGSDDWTNGYLWRTSSLSSYTAETN